MSTLTSTVINSVLAVTLPLEALAVIAAIFVILISLVLTWVVTRFWFHTYHKSYAPYEQALHVQVTNFFNNTTYTLRIYPAAVMDTIFAAIDLLRENWVNLAFIFGLAFAGWAVNRNQPLIGSTFSRMYVCDIVPIVENVPFRLLNLARLIYNGIGPMYSLWVDWFHFLTTGWYRILRECALTEGDFESVLERIGNAAADLGQSLATWFAGDIFSDRLLLTGVFYDIGLAFNAALDPLDCFCTWLHPISLFITSIPQITALHLALEAAVNAAIRVLQVVLTALINVDNPIWSDPTQELIDLVINAGETAEALLLLIVDLLTNLFNEISLLAMSNAAYINRQFGLSSILDEDTGELVPPTLSDLMHTAANTRASPRYGSMGGLRSMDVRMATPIWDLPPTNLSDLLGIPALVMVLSTPWSHAITELVAGGLILANMTLNIISDPVKVFETPEGLAYWQWKGVFDRIRASFDAAAQFVFVIIDPNLPASISLLGQTAITYAEGVMEILMSAIYAIVFPTWVPGVPPPTDCTVVGSCGYPAPGWLFFNFFPAYWDWQGNALRRAIDFLDDDADAIAIVLGCNASEIAANNCTASFPAQCVLRTTFLFAAELLNQSNALVFFASDIVQFDASLHTMQDISFARLQDLFYEWILCLSETYDSFYF